MNSSELYYEELKRLVPLKDKQIKEFLKEIYSEIKEYEQSSNDVTYDMIVEKFGTPEEIITSYFGENPSSLIANLKRSLHIKIAVIAFVSAICLLSLLAGGYEMYSLNEEYKQVIEHQPVYYEEYIIEVVK